MRTRMPHTLVLVAVLLLCGAANAGEPVLVVNKENTTASLSSADIKRIYTGRMNTVGGLKIVPINRPLDSEIAATFLKMYVDMTPQEYKEYWIAKQVKGEGTSPMIQKSAESVKAVVSQVPGAVAYIDEEDLDDTVRRIPVK